MAIKAQAKIYMVYKATFPNEKVYIGVTGQSLEARIQQHSWKHKNKIHQLMFRAITKYGIDNIKWTVEYSTDDKQTAIAKEKELIAKYNANSKDKGYNLTSGGDGCNDLKRHNIRQKYIDNCGNIFIGYEEIYEKYPHLTEGMITVSVNQNLYCGLIYFSRYEEGMTVASPRKFNRCHRKIHDKTNQIVFFSLKDAAVYHNISSKNIQRVCSGGRETTAGISFSYFEEGR